MKAKISYPQEIENWNVPNYMCCEVTCEAFPTNFVKVEIGDFELIVPVCEKHAETIASAISA